jgi:hypothetical protein
MANASTFNQLLWINSAVLKFVALPTWLASMTTQPPLLVNARLLTQLLAIPAWVQLTAMSTKFATVPVV